MQVFEETLDPSETKDFAFTWAPQLGDGETVSTQVVTFIDAAGTTSPSDSLATPVSRVWLTGGTVGQSAIFTIRATTSGGRTLEEAFTVKIVDSVLGVEPATTLERLQAHREKLLDAKDEAIGGSVVEVWNGRYGNKMKYTAMTYDQIVDALLRVDREIAGEERLAAGGGKRGAVGLVWQH